MPFDVISSDVGTGFLIAAMQKPAVRARLQTLPMLQRNQVGYGVTQAFTSGQDVPYKAVTSAAKSAIAIATELDELDRKSKKLHLCGIVFPVIVIDGKLFECHISDAGQMHIDEVESGVLDWKGAHIHHFSAYVHIVTKPALKWLVEHTDETATGLISCIEELKDQLPRIIANVYAPGWGKN